MMSPPANLLVIVRLLALTSVLPDPDGPTISKEALSPGVWTAAVSLVTNAACQAHSSISWPGCNTQMQLGKDSEAETLRPAA